MDGHEIYEYAVRKVPETVKQSLHEAGLTLRDVRKTLTHQANRKTDEAIVKKLFRLYSRTSLPDQIMPMTVSWLGNS